VAGDADQRFNPKNWYHNSLHPNALGHEAMLKVFEDWYREFDADPETGLAPNPRAPEDLESDLANSRYIGLGVSNANDEEPEPLCTPSEAIGSAPGCEDEGVDWALAQVSIAILARGWGLLIALGAVGSWLMWISIGQLIRGLRRKDPAAAPTGGA
jgi:hypothetical protein